MPEDSTRYATNLYPAVQKAELHQVLGHESHSQSVTFSMIIDLVAEFADPPYAFACSTSYSGSRCVFAIPHWSFEACPPECGMQMPLVCFHVRDL